MTWAASESIPRPAPASRTRWPHSLRRPCRRPRTRCASDVRARPALPGSQTCHGASRRSDRAVARRTTVRHGGERYQAPLRRWRQGLGRSFQAPVPVGSVFVLVPGVAGLLELQCQRCIACSNNAAVDEHMHEIRLELHQEAIEVGDGQQADAPLVVSCCKRRATSPRASTSRPESTSSRMQTAGRITPNWTISVRLRSPPERSTLRGRRNRRASRPTAFASSSIRSCSVAVGFEPTSLTLPPQPQQPTASASSPRGPPPGAAAPGTARRGRAPRPAGRSAPARPS